MRIVSFLIRSRCSGSKQGGKFQYVCIFHTHPRQAPPMMAYGHMLDDFSFDSFDAFEAFEDDSNACDSNTFEAFEGFDAFDSFDSFDPFDTSDSNGFEAFEAFGWFDKREEWEEDKVDAEMDEDGEGEIGIPTFRS